MQSLSLGQVHSSIPAPSPSNLRERLECSEGGSTGRRATRPCRMICNKPAVRSASSQDRRSARFIRGFCKKARQTTWQKSRGPGSEVAVLQTVRKFDGKFGALAQLPKGIGSLTTGLPCLFERFEQPVEVLGQELPAEIRIDARARKIVLGNQVIHRLGP